MLVTCVFKKELDATFKTLVCQLKYRPQTDHATAEEQLLVSSWLPRVPFPVRQEALASAELIATRQAGSLGTVHTDYSSHLCGAGRMV